jgi:hypothetical protein
MRNEQPKQFVCLSKSDREGYTRYNFYIGTARVASVESNDLTKEWLEKYRVNHRLLMEHLSPAPESA